MNLARMMTDKFFIENQHGERSGPFKTKFGSGTLMVFQDAIVVTAGDLVIQPLADGSERAYRVEGCVRNAGSRNVPAHYAIRVSEMEEAGGPRPHVHVRMAREHPATEDLHANGPSLAASMQSLALAIDGSNFSAAEKEDARSILRTLLAHPVVAALISDPGRTA